MKNLLIPIILIFGFTSCGGDNDTNSNCDFIGKWCSEDQLTGDCLTIFPTTFEFKSNGDFVESVSGTSQRWESDDCVTIFAYNKNTGEQVSECVVIEVTESTLIFDIVGGLRYDLIKAN